MNSKLTTILKGWLLCCCLLILSITIHAQSPYAERESRTEVEMEPLFLLDCNTAPIITCPSIYYGCPGDNTHPSNTGYATAIAGDPFCDEPIVTYTDSIISTGPCNDAVEIHRFWKAAYPDNNNIFLFAHCTQLVLLSDDTAPTIANCPTNIEVEPNANCEAIVNWSIPTANDNCELQSFTSTHQNGAVFPLGNTTVAYYAIDACGNTSTCSFDVDVVGSCCTAPPLLSCPSDYTGCPDLGLGVTTTGMATAAPGSSFCETPNINFSDQVISNGPCADAVVVDRTWSASYSNEPSLESTCVQRITLADTKAPLFSNVPQNVTVAPDDDCQAVVNWTTPVVTDNCGVQSVTSNFTSGTSFDEGNTTVTYTATDNCGNEATASFVITVTSCCDTPPTITCPTDFNGCPNSDIDVNIASSCTATPSASSGWAVATCNAEPGTGNPVAGLLDIRNTNNAPTGSDWGTSITKIYPANWNIDAIGQVFGIALGDNDDVYLAASDVYDTGYDSDPFGPGQIFRATADNDFLAEPLVALNNSGGALNGIGNIVYDKVYHKLYASNLEDGKIYQISTDGSILNTYDPWVADNGSAGIATPSEQIWGIGMNTEDGKQKLYFARISGATREMYSLQLEQGEFPVAGSETLEISNIDGVGKRISDIAFSDNGERMIFSERGTRFITGAHDSKTLRYSLQNGIWQYDLKYFVGAHVTEFNPSLQVETGENSAGGVDFGPINTNNIVQGCDQTAWATMNWFRTPDGSLYYGAQGMDVDGNNASGASNDPNTETDIIIDFDGEYDNYNQKGDLGDIELFRSGGFIEQSATGVATATSGGNGCGIPLISYTDEVISEGPCDGSKVVERTWVATDSENSQLSSECTQTIQLADTQPPVLSGLPQDVTVAPSTSCNAVVTWLAPTSSDNCGVANLTSNFSSGSLFNEGTTIVTYTATDNCGNSSTASFSVTVEECCNVAPQISCPSNVIDCPGTDTSPSTTGLATATAGSVNCETPVVTYTDVLVNVGPCAGASEVVRTWTAKDPQEPTLSTSCTQMITLVDDIVPVIFNCPTDITVSTTGSSAAVTWISPTATDNCELEWLMADYTSGDVFPLGETVVTYTAVDNCDNVAPCSFTVTVENQGTITCPEDIIVPCSDPQGTVVTWGLPQIETGCTDCNAGDSIPGFVFMGSLNGSLYYCSTSPASASTASGVAASNGGYLASITSLEENQLLAGFLNNQCALIGYSDVNSEGNFVWASGENSLYSNWAEHQPNNENGNQDCAVLCTDGWYDTSCDLTYEYIMEIPCTTYEQTSGQPNGSVFVQGVDTITYLVTDACGNTLECSFTVTIESNTALHCPEDHVFSCPNGQQGVVAHWQTPELTSCCNDCGTVGDSIAGYMYMGSYNGSQYYCSMQNATWPNANTQAQQIGGHLAQINDAGENAFLANILTLQRAWIGLNDVAIEGHYQWSNGEPLTYTNWYPGQPNNQQNYQDYVAMLSNGLWNDEFNNLAMEYIVEVPCTSVQQIGGPTSGSVIPVGTTTITYAGMDACGNTDTCSFDITIIAPTTCPSFGQESWYMWIEHFGLGTYNNTSGNNDGYADFSAGDCIDVNAGETYPITLTPGFASAHYNVYWKTWIDYNQDGDYNDPGEFVGYGNGYSQVNGSLPIASNCLAGQTTMRVAMKYGSYPSGPCAIFSHGEVEDYCINISTSSSKTANMRSNTTQPIEFTQVDFSKAHLVDHDFALANEEVNESGLVAEPVLRTFPNPTSGLLFVELNILGGMDFYILDYEGRVVQENRLHFGVETQSIDLSELSNGLYLLRSADGKFLEKVIVQH